MPEKKIKVARKIEWHKGYSPVTGRYLYGKIDELNVCRLLKITGGYLVTMFNDEVAWQQPKKPLTLREAKAYCQNRLETFW